MVKWIILCIPKLELINKKITWNLADFIFHAHSGVKMDEGDKKDVYLDVDREL